jgi:hypothetical protein
VLSQAPRAPSHAFDIRGASSHDIASHTSEHSPWPAELAVNIGGNAFQIRITCLSGGLGGFEPTVGMALFGRGDRPDCLEFSSALARTFSTSFQQPAVPMDRNEFHNSKGFSSLDRYIIEVERVGNGVRGNR